MSDLPTVEGREVGSIHTFGSIRDQRGGSEKKGVRLTSLLQGILGEEEAKRQGSPGPPGWATEKGCRCRVSPRCKNVLQIQ